MHGLFAKDLAPEDLYYVEELARAEARESFWAYRQLMHPNMQLGWWTRDVANHFQTFYRRMLAGKRPKIIFMAPPQHGKSFTIEDLVSWIAGKQPSWKIIYASYGDDLGIRANAAVQRAMLSDSYHGVFPNTFLNDKTTSDDDVIRWKRNEHFLQWVGAEGSFRNTTVKGPVRGQGLDVGIVDDPIKDRAAARSPVIRQGAWEWLTDDFFSRFSEHAGLVLTLTRTHVEDPAGRWLEKFPETTVLRYPALADNEPRTLADKRYRKDGEALFPEFKSKDFLLERRRVMSEAAFASEYQQLPYVSGGDLFPVHLFQIIGAVNKRGIARTVRYWDKAATEGGGKATAGVLMHEMQDGSYVVEDVEAGHWAVGKRERIIKNTAETDKALYPRIKIYVEQEPGSGGKESAEATIRNLSGFRVYSDKVTGSKEDRAEPYAAQVQGSNVYLVAAPWNREFKTQHEGFPQGMIDMVDAAAGAFGKLTGGPRYDSSMAWVSGGA